MSTAADRKAELELKKERLRALREEKFRREELRRKGLSGFSSTQSSSNNLLEDPDALLKDLGIDPPPPVNTSGDFRGNETVPGAVASRPMPIDKNSRKLQYCLVSEFNVQPHPRDKYTKETQTAEQTATADPTTMNYYVLTYDDSPLENESHLINGSPFDDDDDERPDTKMLKSVHGEIPKQSGLVLKEELKESALVELTEEQKQQMLLSEGFRAFFERSSRIVERALCERDRNPLQDLLDPFSKPHASDDNHEPQSEESVLAHVLDLCSERWSGGRAVVDLDWSPVFPELLMAAYSSPLGGGDDPLSKAIAGEERPAGVVMVWNLKFPTRGSPEFRFHCNESVTAAALARFHPNLVIGGTYSGQVVLWDSRSNKRTPVQRSSFSTQAHTQPVAAVRVIGSQNAHTAVTLSSDATLCAWGGLDGPPAPSAITTWTPREQMRIGGSGPVGAGGGGGGAADLFELHPTCLDFIAGDQNNFLVGSESGVIYADQRHSSRTVPVDGLGVPGSHVVRRAMGGVGALDAYRGHSTVVTSLSTHPSACAVSFAHIFLSASLDWSVRLWSMREGSHTPLHTFEDFGDAVYAVDWSPVHSALFATADGAGRLQIWDLLEDLEAPRCRWDASRALNTARWDPMGLHLAAGDDDGHVHVCAVAPNFALPAADDATRLAHVFGALKANAAGVNGSGGFSGYY